ncbi:hypothetical protein HGG76_27545 [Ochrobactrum tritici]|uniref:Uncharacterized protein n=1 Tax=Brucella tritici TaxID=94626 RepID=A0A7X6JBS6_9HYPH|nr:hypothetical protein [Brucella tritici]
MKNALLIALVVAALSTSTFMASASTSVDGYDGKGQIGIQSDEFKNAAANTYKLKYCADIDATALKTEIETDILMPPRKPELRLPSFWFW